MKLEDFLSRLTKSRLERARRMYEPGPTGGTEIEATYRYFHSSFKVFNLAKAVVEGYVNAMLGLIGLEARYDEQPGQLRELAFDERFVRLVEEAYGLHFHCGEIRRSEWRALAAAQHTVRLAAGASIVSAAEILKGELVQDPLSYERALFIYVWGLTELRYSPASELYDLALSEGSRDIKAIYRALPTLSQR